MFRTEPKETAQIYFANHYVSFFNKSKVNANPKIIYHKISHCTNEEEEAGEKRSLKLHNTNKNRDKKAVFGGKSPLNSYSELRDTARMSIDTLRTPRTLFLIPGSFLPNTSKFLLGESCLRV